MKKVYLLLVACLSFLLSVKSQVDIAIGTGTVGNGATTYPAPLQDFYEGSRVQFLYTAAELSAAGMAPGIISGIKFEVTALNGTTIIEQMKIGIDVTSAASLGTTTWETVTNSVYGPIDYQPLLGMNTFSFSTPYIWNGIDNIVIEICNGDPANAGSITYTNNATTPWTTGLTFNGSHNYRADNLGNLCGTATTTNTGLQTSRPNITFEWTPGTACSGVPTAGTASVSDTLACATQNFTLSLTGATIASGISVQWQSSPDNVVFSNITGGTPRNFITSQMATSYYRAIVKCASDSVFSDTVKVTSPALIVPNTFTINSALPTSGTNFNTFSDAINHIKCGISGPIIFNVAPGSGPYTEQIIIPAIPNTSAVNTVSINGNGASISFGSTDGNNRHVIQFNGSKYVYLRDLIIDANASGATFGWGIHLTKNAAFDSIVNCTITTDLLSTSTNFAGIVISGSNTSATQSDNSGNNIVIKGNTITGGYYGINYYGNSAVPYTDNVQILNNSINDFYYYGINVSGASNTIIVSNNLIRPTRSNVGFSYGINTTSSAISTAVVGNKITNMYDQATASTSTFYAIYVAGDGSPTAPTTVVNNLVADINHNGSIYGLYNAGAANMLAYHNTFSIDNVNATAGIVYGFYQITSDTGIVFRNNNISITRGGTGAKYGIYKGTAATPLVSNNNNIFLNSTGSGLQYFGFNNSAIITLAAWQTATGQDLNSQSIDPLYASTGTDYTPTEAQLNDKGAPVGVTIDITGAPRSTIRPDVGAYEYTIPVCTAPPTAGDARAVNTTVCENTGIILSLLNNSVGLTQTYQWESSASATGPWTPIGTPSIGPDTVIIATVSLYYRAAVTCGTSTVFSTPVQISVSPALVAGNYTINAAQSTGGTNYQSFGDAINALKCGITGPVIFNVDANSSFIEQVTIPAIPGASASNTITFNGNGATLSFGSNDAGLRHVIQLNGADFVTVKNLSIIATGGTHGWGIHLTNQANNDSIINCNITTDAISTLTNYAGIVISGSNTSATTSGNNANNTVIINNTITGGYYGIMNYGNTSPAVTTNNQMINNTINDFYYYGIYNFNTVNSRMVSNKIQRPSRTIVGFTYGIYVAGENSGLLMDMNRVTNLFDVATSSTSTVYGIYVAGEASLANPSTVSNNLVAEYNHNGTIYGIYDVNSRYTRYFHNTVAMNSSNATSGTTYGIYHSGLDTGIIFRNNLIDINRSGTGIRFGIYYSVIDQLAVSNNNNFSITSPGGGIAACGYYNATNQLTLADWQTASTQDANGLAVDPSFVAQGSDYIPTNGVLNDRAAAVGILTDITGAARSASTPDIGAFEFSVAACTSPPTAGTTAANDSLVCAGANVNFSLVGNSFGLTQTYLWETSTSASGPWTPIGSSLPFPDSNIIVSATAYYRAAVTCGTTTTYSSPLLINVKPMLAAGDYTINNALPTGGTNFQSFADAMAASECGVSGAVTFNVAPGSGPYAERLILNNISGTSASNRITFNGNGSTLSFGSNDGNNRSVVQLNGADFVTIKNLNIDATGGTFGWGIHVTNQADNDSIVNCTVTTDVISTLSNFAGIVISGSNSSATTSGNNANNLVVQGNTIYGGYYGIINYGNSTLPGTDNVKIVNNSVNDFYFYGIYTAYSTNARISNNAVERPNRTSVTTTYGIYGTTGTTGALIDKNKVRNLFEGALTSTSTAYGIYLVSDATAATENNVVNNLIYGINHEGSIFGLYNAGSRYSNFYHNTISLDATGATAGSTYGYYQSSSDTAIKIINNVITIARGGSGIKYGMYLASTATPTAISNYNNVYLNSAGSGVQNFGYSGSARLTLSDWQTSTAQDINSITLDPLYTAPSSGDFLPTQATMDNLGSPVGVLFDIRDSVRSLVSPDMGAFEFGLRIVPVTLKSIAATIVKQDVSIIWKTASEINFSYFEVQRSTDGSNFEYIGRVAGIATGSMNKYKDLGIVNRLKAGTVIYYRLKMVDVDGRFKYSPVVNVKISNVNTIVSVYPNPFKDQLFLRLNSSSSAVGTITLSDVTGRMVTRTQQVNVKEGDNVIQVNNLQNLPKGMYIVKLVYGSSNLVYEVVKE